jgi:hypothetical protein
VHLDIDPGEMRVQEFGRINFSSAVTNDANAVHRPGADVLSLHLKLFDSPAITDNLGWENEMLNIGSTALAILAADAR